ncbi:NAD-dependent deacetylase [Jeongeupia wiesaeckerbachi]|uniref:SIR2 family NAD-dependent protein deacylase n=1 Tax=Jeongeupia wiesaeckerbachi TaxID=3051218 RepID=UPI003D809861
MTANRLDEQVKRAAAEIAQADALLITAGAGMGVDSGLPDFRGNEGFWQAYPALGKARIPFDEISTPMTFYADARRAWGFYGHRLRLYRATQPHAGFALLREWGDQRPNGAFVLTSNVDGQFQRAGFDPEQIFECHGSIHHWQCQDRCDGEVRVVAGFDPVVDEAECRLTSPLPFCANCGAIMRPNILMFSDLSWLEQRAEAQRERLNRWLEQVGRLVVIELGAGVAIPTVRMFGERIVAKHRGDGATLIRINPAEPNGPAGTISLPLGGLAGLQQIAQAMAGQAA